MAASYRAGVIHYTSENGVEKGSGAVPEAARGVEKVPGVDKVSGTAPGAAGSIGGKTSRAEKVPGTVRGSRIPPAGPARLATRVRGHSWTVQGDQLVKERPGGGGVEFGNGGWTDYDVTFEACKDAGPDGFGAFFARARKNAITW